MLYTPLLKAAITDKQISLKEYEILNCVDNNFFPTKNSYALYHERK